MLNNKLVTAVIAGQRTEEQWRDYLGALKHGLDAADITAKLVTAKLVTAKLVTAKLSPP